MTSKLRRLILTGLSLVLIGGVLSPTVVQAATTDSTTDSDPSNTDAAVTFGAIQMPYVLITDSHGTTTKVPWYRDFKSQINSRDTILADDFSDNLSKSEPDHFDASETAGRMAVLAKSGITVKPDEKHADYLLSTGMYGNAKNSADITAVYEATTYAYAWLLASAAKVQLHQTNYTSVHADFTRNVLGRLEGVKGMIGSDNFDIFNNVFLNESIFTSQMSLLLRNTAEFHLDSLTVDQLAQLDPTASENAEAKLLQTPMTDLVTTQADGTLLADGLLNKSDTPHAFVLKSAASYPTATSKPVTVHYIDEQGNSLKPDKTLTGSLGDSYKTAPLSIAGYQLVKTTGDESGKFTSSDQSVTYTYRKAAADVVVKNSVVYATKKIGLYGSPTFSKKALKATYAKKSRMNRPMFEVIGTVTSKNGVKRYKVKDLNGKGSTGYITANSDYVSPLY